MATIDIATGSQYFIQDGRGKNLMVKPESLLTTLENMINQDNIKNIVVTIYLNVDREVKIVGDTKYFEFDKRYTEPNAKFVMEKHDVIHDWYKFNDDASVLIGRKGQILTPSVMTSFKVKTGKLIDKKEIDDVTDALKSMSLNDKKTEKLMVQKEIDDVGDTLKSMSLNDKSEIINKKRNIVVM